MPSRLGFIIIILTIIALYVWTEWRGPSKAKAKIITVGYIDENGMPSHFAFDCSETDVAALEITNDGRFLFAGWTVEELRNMAAK